MDTGELTAQEKAISEGKSSWTRTSPGFDRLLEEIRSLPIRLLVERTRILTRVYRETEGQSINLRHARFLKVFAETVAPAAVFTYSLVSIAGTLAAALFMGRQRANP